MDIFFLGAGKPALGKRPSALKEVSNHGNVLDLQLDSLSELPIKTIHFLGGYHVTDVMAKYPQLNYTVIPAWENHSVTHTLLRAPFRQNSAMICYSDTVFRKKILSVLLEMPEEVVFAYDSHWEKRYERRTSADINTAETVLVNGQIVEFTGLVKITSKVADYLSTADEKDIGSSLLSFVEHLRNKGYTISSIDVCGNWAELNSPNDIAHFMLGTKASTLASLAPLVRTCKIGDQFTFTLEQWQNNSANLIANIKNVFHHTKIIIRSSTFCEDSFAQSNAGSFDSIGHIDSTNDHLIREAIERVIKSYQKHDLSHDLSKDTQILVQEQISSVRCAGVILTCGLDTGSPYYQINIDDKTFSTDAVTGGTGTRLRTLIIEREHACDHSRIPTEFLPILKTAQELERILDFRKLDIEFAIDLLGTVHVFQVRPITVDHSAFEVSASDVHQAIQAATEHFTERQTLTPFILGNHAYFGNMPDWNPAEIIGTRPNPLAFSLYRFLITDDTWARQRAESGYRDIRPHPLLVAFCGQPYVDIRASLNSFIPATLTDATAEKIINAYLHRIKHHPNLHDKVEFEVAITCWTPSFADDAKNRLADHDVSLEEINALGNALIKITKTIISELDKNTSSIMLMNERQNTLMNSALPPLRKALSLLSDCKRFGTLAFAHAARAAFVANHYLKSAEKMNIITEDEHYSFLNSIQTVAGEFDADCHFSRRRYGHLRPGTYDINATAYWENPDIYFRPNNSAHRKSKTPTNPFHFSDSTKKQITDSIEPLQLTLSTDDFISFLKKSIQAREFVKFEFTRNLSLALDLINRYGDEIALSRSDLGFLEYQDLVNLDNGTLNVKALHAIIEKRKETHSITHIVTLPPMLFDIHDFYCFERASSEPNFVTKMSIGATCHRISDNAHIDSIAGKIVLISHADPGYDWLFNHSIGGLITQYGGANSHMAIRAAEMGLPAAIGVGDKLYEQLKNAQQIHLDCANATIRIIH